MSMSKRTNIRFLPSAAATQRAGPCDSCLVITKSRESRDSDVARRIRAVRNAVLNAPALPDDDELATPMLDEATSQEIDAILRDAASRAHEYFVAMKALNGHLNHVWDDMPWYGRQLDHRGPVCRRQDPEWSCALRNTRISLAGPVVSQGQRKLLELAGLSRGNAASS
jgi:hypothetical protein